MQYFSRLPTRFFRRAVQICHRLPNKITRFTRHHLCIYVQCTPPVVKLHAHCGSGTPKTAGVCRQQQTSDLWEWLPSALRSGANHPNPQPRRQRVSGPRELFKSANHPGPRFRSKWCQGRAIAELEDVPSQSWEGDCVNRSVCRSDDCLPAALRMSRSWPSTAAAVGFCGDRVPNGWRNLGHGSGNEQSMVG